MPAVRRRPEPCASSTSSRFRRNPRLLPSDAAPARPDSLHTWLCRPQNALALTHFSPRTAPLVPIHKSGMNTGFAATRSRLSSAGLRFVAPPMSGPRVLSHSFASTRFASPGASTAQIATPSGISIPGLHRQSASRHFLRLLPQTSLASSGDSTSRAQPSYGEPLSQLAWPTGASSVHISDDRHSRKAAV